MTTGSVVAVVYAGQKRPLPKERGEFIEKVLKTYKMDPKERSRYKSEILVEEGNRRCWLAIQEELVPAFEAEVKAGSRVELYVTWLGALRRSDAIQWIFSINAFGALGEK